MLVAEAAAEVAFLVTVCRSVTVAGVDMMCGSGGGAGSGGDAGNGGRLPSVGIYMQETDKREMTTPRR